MPSENTFTIKRRYVLLVAITENLNVFYVNWKVALAKVTTCCENLLVRYFPINISSAEEKRI